MLFVVGKVMFNKEVSSTFFQLFPAQLRSRLCASWNNINLHINTLLGENPIIFNITPLKVRTGTHDRCS